MKCSRGQASPDANTQRRLFAASAGFCQNPSCLESLFVETKGNTIHIAEMAHIFAAADNGPRANSVMTKAERGAFENLILLCPICHTKIDKAPGAYPDTMVLGWKREHQNKLDVTFGASRHQTRSDARGAIESALTQNRSIFEQYGPHIEAAANPESGAAEQWRRKMLTSILPNNHKILRILDNNKHLLTTEETRTLEFFRQHIDDLEAVHIAGKKEDATQFPKLMSTILEDK